MMKMKGWKAYFAFILLSVGTGILAAVLTSAGIELYNGALVKPPLSPPGILFPIVWTILYTLMGISAAIVWLSPESSDRKMGLNLFIAQLIVNFFWSLIFFNAQAYGVASVWIVILWASVFIMTLKFYRVDPPAGWIQLPYLLWLTFACYLAFGVWFLN